MDRDDYRRSFSRDLESQDSYDTRQVGCSFFFLWINLHVYCKFIFVCGLSFHSQGKLILFLLFSKKKKLRGFGVLNENGENIHK